MEGFFQTACFIMLAVNLFCGATVAVYYLVKKESRFFNFAGVVWLLAMFCNMALTLGTQKSGVLCFLTMFCPVLLTMMNGMLSSNTEKPTMSRVLQVGAVLYYVYGAFYSYYLWNDQRFAPAENTKTGWVGLILYLVFYLFVMLVFLAYSTREVYISELTMTSVFSFLSFGTMALPVWAWSASIGLIRRFMGNGFVVPAAVIGMVMLITVAMGMTPFLALPNALKNADKAFRRVYPSTEEDEQNATAGKKAVNISVPKMVFGGTETGYVVTKDVKWMDFTFAKEGKDPETFELDYDMYKAAGEEGPTPVLVRIHGSGGRKGTRNNALMSQTIASAGYTVFDLNYGNERRKPTNDELTENICIFLDYLYENREKLQIDTDQIFLSGMSRGGKMALKVTICWANNSSHDLYHKITIRGCISCWGFMNDVFRRTGSERIVSEEELTAQLPDMLFIDTTNDGSVQGGLMMEGFLHSLGVKAANIELRYAMHSADIYYYGLWGQMTVMYLLRFMKDRVAASKQKEN